MWSIENTYSVIFFSSLFVFLGNLFVGGSVRDGPSGLIVRHPSREGVGVAVEG